MKESHCMRCVQTFDYWLVRNLHFSYSASFSFSVPKKKINKLGLMVLSLGLCSKLKESGSKGASSLPHAMCVLKGLLFPKSTGRGQKGRKGKGLGVSRRGNQRALEDKIEEQQEDER